MKNIVLIGMPGCGKSTLGVVLAKNLNMGFCDTDLFIQQFEKRKLQEIINADGVDEFLRKEEKYIMSFESENMVIATGGSVVLSKPAMEHLKKNGDIIYLKVDYSNILRRIKNRKSRGIAMVEGQTLKDIYAIRTPLYEKYADITIDCNKRKFNEIVDELAEMLNR